MFSMNGSVVYVGHFAENGKDGNGTQVRGQFFVSPLGGNFGIFPLVLVRYTKKNLATLHVILCCKVYFDTFGLQFIGGNVYFSGQLVNDSKNGHGIALYEGPLL
jgi:hypothetical protein